MGRKHQDDDDRKSDCHICVYCACSFLSICRRRNLTENFILLKTKEKALSLKLFSQVLHLYLRSCVPERVIERGYVTLKCVFSSFRGDISRVFQSYLFSLLLQYGRRAASGGNRENVSYKQLYILVDSCYRVERRNWIFTLSWNFLVTCYSFILCVEASTAVDDRLRCNHVQGSACKWTLQIQGKDPWKRAVMEIRCPAAQRHPPAGL